MVCGIILVFDQFNRLQLLSGIFCFLFVFFYHCCPLRLVLEASSPSKSLCWCHTIKTTAKPRNIKRLILILLWTFELRKTIYLWLLLQKKNKTTILPGANTVICSAALVPRACGRGLAIGTAAIWRLYTVRANHSRPLALCGAGLWSGSYCN